MHATILLATIANAALPTLTETVATAAMQTCSWGNMCMLASGKEFPSFDINILQQLANTSAYGASKQAS